MVEIIGDINNCGMHCLTCGAFEEGNGLRLHVCPVWIYKMNECEWIFAPSLDQAIEWWKENFDNDPEYWEDAEPISQKDMDKFKFCDEDWNVTMTFREQLRELIHQGERFGYFATSEY